MPVVKNAAMVSCAHDHALAVVQLVDFVVTRQPPPGSIWADTDTLAKKPLPGTNLELEL